MRKWFSHALDKVSEFLAARKGLLPLIGILLVLLNLILQTAPNTWAAQSNFFLHLGVILAIIGFLLSKAL